MQLQWADLYRMWSWDSPHAVRLKTYHAAQDFLVASTFSRCYYVVTSVIPVYLPGRSGDCRCCYTRGCRTLQTNSEIR